MKKLLFLFIGIFALSNLRAQEIVEIKDMQGDSIDTSFVDLDTKLLDSLLIALFSDTNALFYQTAALAGRWEDDNGNWERAFDAQPSPGINIVHSFYWRSAHFTVEHEYFFQLEYGEELEASFFRGGDLVKMEPSEYENIQFFLEKPKWFVPDEYANYDIWKSNYYETYYLFIDKEKKRIFFTQFVI